MLYLSNCITIGIEEFLEPDKGRIESSRMTRTQYESAISGIEDIVHESAHFIYRMDKWLLTEYMFPCVKYISHLREMVSIW